MQAHAGLAHPPMFAPSVGRYAQGMIVEVPLQLWALPGKPTPADLHAALAAAYAGEPSSRWPSGAECAELQKARAGAGGYVADARSRGAERHQPHAAVRLRQRRAGRRRGWWPCWTTSARGRPARRCRTST